MASAPTFDAVVENIADRWADRTDVVYENDPYDLPAVPAHFVYVEVFGDFFDQASLGAELQEDNLWREGGSVLLHVMTPKNTGSRKARELAMLLVRLFCGQNVNGVRFRDASIGEGDPGRSFANYWAMTASVSYERDE